MRRSRPAFADILAILTALAPLAALTLAPRLAAAATGEAGQVLAVRRETVVQRAQQSLAAKPEMPLLLDDAVATGEQARAKLFFRDDSILNLGEKSRVQVKEYLFSPEKNRSKSVYQLLDGSLKVVVGRSDLEIHTTTAVAAARGTSFLIWSEGERAIRSCLMVLDGQVALRNLDPKIKDEVLVDAGRMSCVPVDEPPGRATAIDADLLKRMSAETSVITGADWELLRKRPPAFGRGGGGSVPAMDPSGSGGGATASPMELPETIAQPASQQPLGNFSEPPPAPAPPPTPPPPPPPEPSGPPPEEQQR